MKNVIVLALSLFGIAALAQVVPTPVPVVPAPAPVTGISLSTISAIVVPLIMCLNIALSAVQQIFAKLAKSEPGVVQQISSVVAKIAQYLGSNPSL